MKSHREVNLKRMSPSRPKVNRFGNECRAGMQERQSGQALLILLALLAVIMVAASVTAARGTQQSNSFRTAQTQQALNAAKQGLVGFAAGVTLTTVSPVRPGELPCPDLTNTGF